ncbi:MAG: phosphoribosylformylglycinamidine synthase subunit PurQ [bacterium]|nr:phosphoribosylformylglycinamidine synthase subunit PurQ [bacterium]
MNNKGTLILSGLGLNCERETAYACERSGAAKVEVRHSLELLRGQVSLGDYDFLIFIGGFLDGDYLGSARVGANRYKYSTNAQGELKDQLAEFVAQGHLVMGICNGFQLLVKLGLLPFEELAQGGQSVTLTHNSSGIFEDRWVHTKVNERSNNIFLQGIEQIYLPIRHGEGKIVVSNEQVAQRIQAEALDLLYYADDQGNSTAEYPANPNGSWNNVAGLGNAGGNVLGLMPHPEAYNHHTNHPHWTRLPKGETDGEGLRFFKNAYRHLAG